MKQAMMIAAALLPVLLGACAKEYVYTPPSTPEGRACVQRCQTDQQTCRRGQDRRAEAAAEDCRATAERRELKCEAEATVEYMACLKYAKTDADREACTKESCEPDACTPSPNYSLCDGDFRVCFQSCGGTIDVRD
jgi:hypothetical protein